MFFNNKSDLNAQNIISDNLAVGKLGEMAAKIAYYNFEWRFDTLVIFNLVQLVALQTFFIAYGKAVVVKRGKYIPDFHFLSIKSQVPQFVLFGEDGDELAEMLQWMFSEKYDNTAKYIVVCSSPDPLDCDEEAIFETVVKVYVANIVFLKVSEDRKNSEAYTLNPLLPGKCWNNEPVRLNMTYDCANDTCYLAAFPDKFYNLYQCPLKISTFEQPPFMYLNTTDAPSGGDGDILKMVASILNASLVIKTPIEGADWGHFENNNWTGSLGDVYNHRAQASMCSTPMTPAKYGNFQISFTYNSMDMVWATALPSLKPSWEKLLSPLSIKIRVILLFIFIGIVFMNTFTKTKVWNNIRRTIGFPPPKSNLLFYTWIIFLGMPVMRMPSRLPFRIMFCVWVWGCYIIRTVYQGALVGSLKHPSYEETFGSFQEILNNRKPFGGMSTLKEYYSDDRVVYENWNHVEFAEIYNVLDKMAAGESDFVIALNKETIVDHLLKSGGSKRLQIISEKIVNSPTVIYFHKKSHLTSPISHYLTIFLEGGFSQRLYAKYLSHVKILFSQSTTNVPEALRLEHFTGCIIMLLGGWMLSLLFFVIEVMCGRK